VRFEQHIVELGATRWTPSLVLSTVMAADAQTKLAETVHFHIFRREMHQAFQLPFWIFRSVISATQNCVSIPVGYTIVKQACDGYVLSSWLLRLLSHEESARTASWLPVHLSWVAFLVRFFPCLSLSLSLSNAKSYNLQLNGLVGFSRVHLKV